MARRPGHCARPRCVTCCMSSSGGQWRCMIRRQRRIRMAEDPVQFEAFFRMAFNHEPFDYQCRLATSETLYSLVNVPTGAGKTAAILGAWLWRRLHNPTSVGRRIVYCLPMRTLVEQTVQIARKAVDRLIANGIVQEGRFEVHVLMGGEVSDTWDASPERECILIGTQDML